MGYTSFFIQDFKIKFNYPDYWIHSLEDGATHLFFNKRFGSFRVTAIKIDDSNFHIDSFLNKEYDDNIDANPQSIHIGKLRFIYYKERAKEEDGTTIEYFISGRENILIVTSFAYPTDLSYSDEVKNGMHEVRKALATFRIEK